MFNRVKAWQWAVAVLVLPHGLLAAPAGTNALFQAGEQFWTQQIAALGGRYRPAKLAHFSGPTQGICALQSAVVGAFYCPAEETVYVDDAALQALRTRMHDDADADAAIAYVIGHELAHHVQAIIGTTAVVQQARMRSAPAIASQTFVTFELQADCYAGLWLRWAHANGTIQLPTDLAAMLAATAVAEKARAGQQALDPLSEGTAALRLNWVDRGLKGQFNDCDTFGAEAKGTL